MVQFSWATLQQTAGLSDTQINNNLRATMLYQTFRENALVDKDYVPAFFTPLEASDVPLLQDLERRWTGFSAEDLQSIIGDYEWERNALSYSKVPKKHACVEPGKVGGVAGVWGRGFSFWEAGTT